MTLDPDTILDALDESPIGRALRLLDTYDRQLVREEIAVVLPRPKRDPASDEGADHE